MIFGYTLFFDNRVKIYVTIRNPTSYTSKKIARVIRESICNNSIALWSFTEQQYFFLKKKDNQKG